MNKYKEVLETSQPLTLPRDPDRQRLWRAALKIPMYSVAVLPIAGGTALAWYRHGQIHLLPFGLFLMASVLILVWMNISNDVFDATTGIDVHKHHSLVQLTGQPQRLLTLAHACLLTGVACVVAISWWQRDPVVVGLVLLCCLLGYTYQGPPFRLGYLGLGEPICFVCFGPLAIQAVYYSQTQQWSMAIVPLSLLVGLTTTLILFCSHFHQVSDDVAAGKRSPVVRLGSRRAAQCIPVSCALFFGGLLVFVALGWLPWWTGMALLSVPWAYRLSRLLLTQHDQPQAIGHSKFIAVSLHFWSGLGLCLGLVLGRL
ncbi:MAG: 2-carboxy-1,4-naphthoquinone phytyltransferase [Synechococcales cyanobacterium]